MRDRYILAAFLETVWAILPEKLDAIAAVVEAHAANWPRTGEFHAASRQKAVRAGKPTGGSVAVVPILGTIMQRAGLMEDYSGGVSTETIKGNIQAALADTNVQSILLDVDSPGGSAGGVTELADFIRRAGKQKPVVALANGMAASAAYWIASAASELYVTPSGQVGSIGVYGVHVDETAAMERAGLKVTLVSAGKFKTVGHPAVPMDDAGRELMQERVDAFYQMFAADVARGRGVSDQQVQEGFGQGFLVGPRDAQREGMVDGVLDFDAAVDRASRLRVTNQTAAADAAAEADRNRARAVRRSILLG